MQGVSDYTNEVTKDWKRIHADVDVEVLKITIRIIRAGRILESQLHDLASKNGFAAPGDYEVMAALRRAYPSGLRPAELAERLMVTTSGMTGRLDRLEQDGLVERRPHPTDRRAIEVFITGRGIHSADEVFRDRQALESSLVKNIPPTQRRKIAELLEVLLTELGDVR